MSLDAQQPVPAPAAPEALEPVAYLRNMIMAGKFKPGERLPTERQLATQLGCSRGSVREAISQLAALNLLVSRHGDGTYVTELSSEDLVQPLAAALELRPESLLHLLELRLVIEPWVAANAAMRISEESIADLERLVDEYDQSVEENSEIALVDIDERIHMILAEAHGNPLFTTILQALRQSARRGRSLTMTHHDSVTSSAFELRSLVEAIAARDPMKAQMAMTAHIFHTRAAAESALRDRS